MGDLKRTLLNHPAMQPPNAKRRAYWTTILQEHPAMKSVIEQHCQRNLTPEEEQAYIVGLLTK